MHPFGSGLNQGQGQGTRLVSGTNYPGSKFPWRIPGYPTAALCMYRYVCLCTCAEFYTAIRSVNFLPESSSGFICYSCCESATVFLANSQLSLLSTPGLVYAYQSLFMASRLPPWLALSLTPSKFSFYCLVFVLKLICHAIECKWQWQRLLLLRLYAQIVLF